MLYTSVNLKRRRLQHFYWVKGYMLRYAISPNNKTMFIKSSNRVHLRPVASLTVPGGQSSTFVIFSSNFDQFFLFFLKVNLFSSSFWLFGWASRQPGKALATPLVHLQLLKRNQILCCVWLCHVTWLIVSFSILSMRLSTAHPVK